MAETEKKTICKKTKECEWLSNPILLLSYVVMWKRVSEHELNRVENLSQ